MSTIQAAFKRLVVGRPMSSGELEHTLLPKTIALPVFSSDALSSVAYASQEVLLVLAAVGTAALGLVFPISIAVSILLAVVVISYRQTVRAYPQGGGAYRVAHENLGMYPGLLAGSAILVDYVLTVAVSMVAGVDAIVSALPALVDVQVPLTIGFIFLVTLLNLRGVKESGVFFAIPTYGFIVAMYLLLGTGITRCLVDCPLAESAGINPGHAVAVVTPFLLLRAFAQGTTALTGVEAISDGVAAFRYPQSRNAATTLAIMAALSISMFLGTSWLMWQTHVVYTHDAPRTAVAQVANAVFGGGPLFYFVQVMTSAILILAANTAFADFPRLSSILAKDRFMPHQFMNRGDRLVFSNGIVILATLASLLVFIFDADINQLINLYLVGVFISFTLSQTGMVLRWRRTKEPGWKRSSLINAFGATMTGIVLVVVVVTKFSNGAWIVLAGIPVLMFLMRGVHMHYQSVASELAHPARRPADRRPGDQHMVILVRNVDAATARAVGYVRSVRPETVTALSLNHAVAGAWKRLAPEIPMKALEGQGSVVDRLQHHLRRQRKVIEREDFLTVVTPEVLQSRGLIEIIRHPGLHRLKASLLTEVGVQVLDVPVVTDSIDPSIDQAHEPARNYVCVLVSGMHNATLQAIEYAETLRPTDLRALTFGLDPDESSELGDDWLRAQIPYPLEIEASPFRDIGISLIHYVRQFEPDGLNRVVTVVLPEFVVQKARHQILHNQTALVVKRRMLFQDGVIVVSVPYRLLQT
jgi:amino acid transporter